MNYRVGWVPDTYIELAYIWALAPDPAAVRLASRAIELELATDPELKALIKPLKRKYGYTRQRKAAAH